MIEPLESRLHLLATLADGVLNIVGTSQADTILIEAVGNKIRVTEGAKVMDVVATAKNFNASQVTRINVNGAAGDDTITNATSKPSILRGGAGRDTITGGSGKDKLFGGTADDLLDGGLGADVIRGDDGIDTVTYESRTANLVITLNDKADDGQAGEKDNVSKTTENVNGGSGDDRITGTNQNNEFRGRAGNDTLIGLGGSDLLAGGAGSDSLLGGKGNDLLAGGEAMEFDTDSDEVDFLDGGEGFDLGNKGAVDTHQNLEGIYAPGPI